MRRLNGNRKVSLRRWLLELLLAAAVLWAALQAEELAAREDTPQLSAVDLTSQMHQSEELPHAADARCRNEGRS